MTIFCVELQKIMKIPSLVSWQFHVILASHHWKMNMSASALLAIWTCDWHPLDKCLKKNKKPLPPKPFSALTILSQNSFIWRWHQRLAERCCQSLLPSYARREHLSIECSELWIKKYMGKIFIHSVILHSEQYFPKSSSKSGTASVLIRIFLARCQFRPTLCKQQYPTVQRLALQEQTLSIALVIHPFDDMVYTWPQ